MDCQIKLDPISTWWKHTHVLLKKHLIKNIFAEEFQKQEKNIKIIRGNFEITMKKIKDLEAEVSDLKDRLEFTKNVIEKKVEKLETELYNLLIELEDRSRRNNIRINGIQEEKGKRGRYPRKKRPRFSKRS